MISFIAFQLLQIVMSDNQVILKQLFNDSTYR